VVFEASNASRIAGGGIAAPVAHVFEAYRSGLLLTAVGVLHGHAVLKREQICSSAPRNHNHDENE
jgi:hypothetical protein